MIHPKLFPFFRKLDKNNSKAWFNPRKVKYKEMHSFFAEGMDELAVEIAEFDERVERYIDSPKAVKVFRIYKDTRFSKSEIPLKTTISGLVAGGLEGPFYYLQVGPDQTIAGGGIYLPSPPLLRVIREELEESYQDLESILNDPPFKKVFPEGLKTEFEVKTAHRGYTVDHPAIEYLRKKSFTVTKEFTDNEAQADDFHNKLIQTFELQYKLNRYLQRAFHRLEDKKATPK